MTTIFEVEVPVGEDNANLEKPVFIGETITSDSETDDLDLVKHKKPCLHCGGLTTNTSKLCTNCSKQKANTEKKLKKTSTLIKPKPKPKPKPLTEEERNEIIASFESEICNNCSKSIESYRLGYGFELCELCDLKKNGIMCYNCSEKKFSCDFDSRKSVMCEDCFDRKPNWNWDDLIHSVSEILHLSSHTSITNHQEAELSQMDTNIAKQQYKIEQVEQKLNNLRQNSADLSKQYHMQGVVIDDIDDLDVLDPADFNSKQDPELIPGLTAEYKQKKKNLIRRMKHISNERFDEQKELSELHKTRFELVKTSQENMKKFVATDNQVQDLYDLIVNGENTRTEILELFFRKYGIKIKNKILHLDVLDKMITKHQLVSEGLMDLEKEIRAGEDKSIEDLIISINPLKAWFNNSIEFDEEHRVRFSELYESYKEFVNQLDKKPITKKAFSEKFMELCEGKGSVQKYKSMGFDKFKGISLL